MSRLPADAPDIEVLAHLKAGNQDALAILYDRYAGLVFTIASQILNQRDEAEDLTQDVFLTFWKQDKFDATRGRLSTYLALLTRSRALNKLESRHSRQRVVERLAVTETEVLSGNTPLEAATLAEQQSLVQQALGQLSAQQRQILELSYYQGFSQAQIAEQLTLPLGTVKTNARQGLLKLRKILGETVSINMTNVAAEGRQ
jgi:RNA polymerase sigma-70 factor, ECF subfamily